ncbi:MAG: 3-hydroxyacyl-CoA dehydrogenase [Desulfobacterales bacterium]|nr:3-hydroxyacyl-CoA dehydrogenase [Desulfobacterales bacterium]
MEIKNSIAIVAGGASGLGEATVCGLVKEGSKVAVLDFDEEKGKKLVLTLDDNAIFCKTDISDEVSVKDAIEKTITAFGAIHIAVNCAGIAPPAKVLGKKGPIAISDFNRVIQINLIGTMNIVRLAAEKMVYNKPNDDGEKGVIINTASIAAFEGQVGQAAYSASKAGVVGMTLPIAREFADIGIRVITIAPGLFDTPMLAGLPEKARASLIQTIPFPRRLAKPSEYAMLVKHIIENPVLNGETIRLDSAIRMGAR